MNGEINFTPETLRAMMSLLRFVDNIELYDYSEEKPLPFDYKGRILYFKKYVEKNELKSPIITKCECTEGLSMREEIFNVCETCKGVISEDFLSHPAQDKGMKTSRIKNKQISR